jgi:F-type H+-transporting ATPase subunit delta
MIDPTLIRRYAAAIYRLAEEAGQVEVVREELARLQLAATSDSRVLAILRHPGIGGEQKRQFLLQVAGGSPTPITAGLLTLVLEKDRAEVLLGICDVFTELADEAAGRVRARVEVAWEPDEEQKERLVAALSRLVGAPVVAEYVLTPEVLGGARVHVAGRRIDGSLAGRLEEMVSQVSAAPVLR